MSKQFVFTDDNGQQYPEWEQKKLGEVISEGKAGGTPTASNKAFYNGAHAVIPFLGISDMTSQGKHLSSTSKCITQEALDSSSAWLVPAGHLVYAMYASVGKVGITQTPMAMSQALFAMDFNEGAFTEYVYSYLEQFRENGLDALITTGTQGNINASTLRSIVIPLPSLPEQKKIADFFSALDERIELTENKLALLKEQKKGFLQQVFNRELVFTDDNGDQYPEWEQKGFTEVLEPTPTKKHQIFAKDINLAGKFEVVDQGKSQVAGYSDEQDKVFSDVPAIVYGDHTTIIKFRKKEFIIGADGTKVLTAKGLNTLEFLFHALSYYNVEPEGYKRHYSIVKSVSLPIPSLPEQKKIAEFFTALDERIELTENKLALLKEQKKGYLQGIFG